MASAPSAGVAQLLSRLGPDQRAKLWGPDEGLAVTWRFVLMCFKLILRTLPQFCRHLA